MKAVFSWDKYPGVWGSAPVPRPQAEIYGARASAHRSVTFAFVQTQAAADDFAHDL